MKLPLGFLLQKGRSFFSSHFGTRQGVTPASTDAAKEESARPAGSTKAAPIRSRGGALQRLNAMLAISQSQSPPRPGASVEASSLLTMRRGSRVRSVDLEIVPAAKGGMAREVPARAGRGGGIKGFFSRLGGIVGNGPSIHTGDGSPVERTAALLAAEITRARTSAEAARVQLETERAALASLTEERERLRGLQARRDTVKAEVTGLKSFVETRRDRVDAEFQRNEMHALAAAVGVPYPFVNG